MLKLRKRLGKQKGFTLIELIVVIAILGVLAAVAVPRVTGVVSDAKTASAEALEATIQSAVERYRIDHNDAMPVLSNLYPDYLDEDLSNNEEFNISIDSNNGIVTVEPTTEQ